MGESHQQHVAHFGSNANNGTNAGTFYWNLNNSGSNANRNIATQVNHLKLTGCDHPASWPNREPQQLDERGLDFVGFVFRADSTRLRKSIATKFKRRCRSIRRGDMSLDPFRVASGIGSYWGWCKAADAKKLWQTHVNVPVRRAVRRDKQIVMEIQQCA